MFPREVIMKVTKAAGEMKTVKYHQHKVMFFHILHWGAQTTAAVWWVEQTSTVAEHWIQTIVGCRKESNGLIYLMYFVVMDVVLNSVSGLNYSIVNHQLKLLQIIKFKNPAVCHGALVRVSVVDSWTPGNRNRESSRDKRNYEHQSSLFADDILFKFRSKEHNTDSDLYGWPSINSS